MSLLVDVKKRFPNFDLEVDFEAGNETLGFLGASGSGKSLTLRCIAGLETPDEGVIIVEGMTFFDSKKGINLSPQQRKTALLFQNYMLFPNLTVAENIAAGIPLATPKDVVHDLVEKQLILFGLQGFGKRYPIRLSGGQQQRVALARMLAATPKILMLDEPFSALDSHLKSALEQDMLDLFERFDGSILYVSHDIDEAFHFCDRIAVIDHGSLKELAATKDILSSPSTLATLKVSGVKNISPARRISERQVEATAWGLTLFCQREVPADVAYIGVRASYLRRANGEDHNVFDMQVYRSSDSRFERTVMLSPVLESPDNGTWSSGGNRESKPSLARIQWKVDKLAVSEAGLPVKGDVVRLFIPPEHIYLVTR
ncbi:MAG: ATP-binding cassette domain-containing protein [Coriobacteriaceae bacterium]|nr:ATP-binding cassette domain-containing protein [Coriobacteriaceae bacterium]